MKQFKTIEEVKELSDSELLSYLVILQSQIPILYGEHQAYRSFAAYSKYNQDNIGMDRLNFITSMLTTYIEQANIVNVEWLSRKREIPS